MRSSIRNANEGGGGGSVSSTRSVPRFAKVRRNSNSITSRRSNNLNVDETRDFLNPFCSQEVSEGSVRVDDDSRFQELFENYSDSNNKSDDSTSSFVFGASNLMMNLNLGSEKHFENLKKNNLFNSKNKESLNSKNLDGSCEDNIFVFGAASSSKMGDSSLDDEMRKLNIESFGNVGNKVEKSGSLDFKLLEEILNLTIKDNGGDVEKVNDRKFKSMGSDKKSFVFGNSGNSGSSSDGSVTSVLPKEMNKSNIDDSKVDKKNVYIFGSSKKDSGSFSPSGINVLHEGMSKLNMGSKTGDPSAFLGTTSSSSFNAQPKVSTDNIDTDLGVGNAMHEPFSFQASKPSRGSSVGTDHSVQPNDDSKTSGTSTSSFSFHTAGLSFQSAGNVSEKPTVDVASTSSYSFYSAGLSFQSDGNVFEEPIVDSPGNKAEFTVETPHADFKTPKQDDSCSSTTNLFTGLNPKLEFSAKNGAIKDTKSKKNRGKMRKPARLHQPAGHYNISGQYNISSENSFSDNADPSESYSPMDVSPFRESLASDKSSRDTSVASDEYFLHEADRRAGDAHSSVSVDAIDEDLVTATEGLDINEDDAKWEESKEGSMDNFKKDVHIDEFVSGVGGEYLRSKTEADIKSNASVAAIERDTCLHSHVESMGNDGRMEFCFATSSENVSGANFTFAASTSAQGHTSAAKRHSKKKSRSKVGQDTYNNSLNAKLQFTSPNVSFSPLPGLSSHPVTEQNRQGDPSLSQFVGENRAEADKEPKVKQGSSFKASATVVAHGACEKWRLRGNQAYSNGDLSKAEDYYTRGLNSVPKNETSEGCLTALTLCYSNRAAARMSSGRMRAALEDCKKAAVLNPDFRKVQVRAANCYLALGEIEDALQYFKSSLPAGADLCLDRKIVIEASNGLQKAQQANEYLHRCGELLQRRTSNDAESAMRIIAEALLISPYSEKLVELKAEALLMLRKYEEMIQLCEQSLDSADKNSSSASAEGAESIKNCPARLWRWRLIAKSYFYLGRLEETLEKLEQAESVVQKFGCETSESSSALAFTVRELLRHKAAGNEAFQSGRHSEAVEHYTSALSCNLESRPFAAICFCNRAAAHQALGQITDAIADCSLAIALDGNYPKAISRRATLHEMIRDYSHAAIDLQRLATLLEKQTEEKPSQSGTLGRSTSGIIDLRQAHSRLSTVEEEAKRGIPLDFYLIMGIESSGNASDIKKAYRKAALRHHPDKAAQVLLRSENGDDGVWKEIAEEVYKDADRLFKMIGEAYAVLSDQIKRSQYDEEEIRYTKKGSGCSTSDVYNSPFERSSSRRQWQEVRRSYRNQNSNWSETSRGYF